MLKPAFPAKSDLPAYAGEDESESESSDESKNEDEEGLWQELQLCSNLGGEVGPLTHSLLFWPIMATGLAKQSLRKRSQCSRARGQNDKLKSDRSASHYKS